MDEPTRSPGGPLGRRAFLKGAGAGVVVVASGFPDWLFGQVVRASLLEVDGVLTATLYRPEDQTWLRFEFVDLTLDERTAPPRLVPIPGGRSTPAVRVRLSAQHVAEDAIAPNATPGTGPIGSRVAGESRLVFPVDRRETIPFTAAALLSLAGRALQVATSAGDPGPLTSMIEVPTDLRSSPAASTRVHTDVTPVTRAGVTQLSRLRLSDSDGTARFRPVFAVTPDPAHEPAGRVPNAADRAAIVQAATARGAPPAAARRLWLSLHGAWADIDADWGTAAWSQWITGGRDLSAQVTRRGFAMPFGVPASWVTTSTRVWTADPGGGVVATLVSEEHVVIPGGAVELFDPTDDTFDPAHPVPGAPADGRRMPFRRVRPEPRPATRARKEQLTWTGGSIALDHAWAVHETVFGARMNQAFALVDAADHEAIPVSVPIVFVPAERANDATVAAGLREFYTHRPEYATASLREDVAWAPELEPGSRLTTASTTSISFGVDTVPGPVGVSIWPVVTGGRIQIPVIGAPPRNVDVTFADRWVDHATDADQNPDLAFVSLAETVELPLGVEARAIMTPDLEATVLNQTFGIGADPVFPSPGGVNGPTWSPSDAFGDAAKLLGRFALDALIDAVRLSQAVPGVDIPTITTSLVPPTLPTELRTIQEWCPERVNPLPALGFIATDHTRLCVRLEAVVALDPAVTPRAEVEFSVRDFTLHIPPLVPAVELDVTELRVTQPSDGPVDLVFEVDDWRLGSSLSWLRPLLDLFQPGGSGMDIDISTGAIGASLTLPIPDVDFGVMSISNVAVDLAADFPFLDDAPPLVSIDVGTPSAPIGVRLLQFRGAFFTRLRFSPDGLELLRIRAEVSARLVEIDIGIATAYCEVGVAAEFRWDGAITFSGSLWLEASFDVLGIVNATLRITGTVTYQQALERIRVAGTISWSVTAIFTASGSVEIGALTFALGGGNASTAGLVGTSAVRSAPRIGSGSTATGFGDQHTLTTWSQYVTAFAA